jgi:flagellar biogenesis protein FliO
MPAIPQDMPLWLIKLLAVGLGLLLVLLLGWLVSRFFRKLTKRMPLD